MLLSSRLHFRSFISIRHDLNVRSQTRHASTHREPVVVGIRREDPARIWERRCPITPQVIRELVQKDGVRVLFQPCERRVFTIKELVEAGAEPHPTLSPAHILLGIKETPLNELLVDPVTSGIYGPSQRIPRTHIMFSHTVKGQTYNMPLLSRFLDPVPFSAAHTSKPGVSNGPNYPTLIDYELLLNEDGKRAVGFGWFAGVAGALEGLVSTSIMLLELGVASPFLSVPRPHTATIPQLRNSLHAVGKYITDFGTPKSMGPFIICVTGRGNVSEGALSILKELPLQHINVQDLPGLVTNPDTELNKVYVVHALPKDYLVRKDGGQYSRDDYYANPDQYISTFHENVVAPYLSVLINGVGWSPGFPRLMTNDQLLSAHMKLQRVHQQLGGVEPYSRVTGMEEGLGAVMKGRCRSFADVSCDIEGGLEFVPRSSTLSEPFFDHRPPGYPLYAPPLKLMSVDILPTALPYDASNAFSENLLPLLKSKIAQYGDIINGHPLRKDPYTNLLQNATIAEKGQLTPGFEYLKDQVRLHGFEDPSLTNVTSPNNITGESTGTKKILLLGSGMVAAPLVDHLCKRSDIQLLVVSEDEKNNGLLTAEHHNALYKTMSVNAQSREQLSEIIRSSNLVISLLPAPMHPAVAEICIQEGKNMVTASYISPAMKELHDKAASKNVLLLNEIGLDPGIDHCSALALIDNLRKEGKKISSFISFCGGLPAPQFANVPLGYKFSWSPQGVLSAALNGASFKLDGNLRTIGEKKLLLSPFPELSLAGLKFEGLANRDSLKYAELYQLGPIDELQTVLRGTLRFPGFSRLLHLLQSIGLLENEEKIKINSWESLVFQAFSTQAWRSIESWSSFDSALSEHMDSASAQSLKDSLAWILSPERAPASISSQYKTPLQHLASLLSSSLAYGPDEKDMVVLQHEILAQKQQGDKMVQDQCISSFVAYGTSKYSAMASCVGLPLALASEYVLDNKMHLRGVQGPSGMDFCNFILDSMAELGYAWTDDRITASHLDNTLEKHLSRSLK